MKRHALSQRAYACQGEVESDHVRENAGFVVSERGVVVIDTTRTLADAVWVYRQIRAVTDKPLALVINTHCHPDHVFGNQVFSAPILAHELTKERMRSLLSTAWSSDRLAQLAEESTDPGALEALRIVLPHITFSERLTLDMGDLALQVLYTGGHTSGSCIVYLPEEEILYIADLLFVGRYPAMMDANLQQWIAALDWVKGMKVRMVVPGHGEISTMQEVVGQQNYLMELRDRVATLAQQGLSKEEIIAHPSFGRYAERAYQRAHGPNIGIAYDQVVGKG